MIITLDHGIVLLAKIREFIKLSFILLAKICEFLGLNLVLLVQIPNLLALLIEGILKIIRSRFISIYYLKARSEVVVDIGDIALNLSGRALSSRIQGRRGVAIIPRSLKELDGACNLARLVEHT